MKKHKEIFPVLTMIFSFNRAMQLDALLTSLMHCCKDFSALEIKIIYKASGEINKKNYNELIQHYDIYKNIKFIPEISFKNDVIREFNCYQTQNVFWKRILIAKHQSAYRFVMFLVDDCLFVNSFHIAKLAEELAKNKKCLAFSLRLGRNTTFNYVYNKPQRIPDFTQINEGILSYNSRTADGNFRYRADISSSVYRVADILPYLADIDYGGPNELEGVLATVAGKFFTKKIYLMCFTQSVAFCAPVNKVQTVAKQNRTGTKEHLSAAYLAERFAEGWRVDVRQFYGFIPISVHQEVEMPLKK